MNRFESCTWEKGLAIHSSGKVFRVITAVMSESREKAKVTFFECVEFLFSKCDCFGTDIEKDALIVCSAVKSNSDVIGLEFVAGAEKISKRELSEDKHDYILN